jgi:hypothetical protein
MAFIPPLIAAAGSMMASAGATVGSMFAAGAGAAGAAASSSLGLGALSTGLSTVGGVLGAVNSYQQGMFQSKIASYNAQLANQNRQASLTSGQNAEEIKRMQTGKLVGSEAAATAAGGIDVGSGSPEAVREATRMAGEYDALNIRYNAARQAYGYSQEAFSDLLQSKVAKQNAVSGLVGGLFNAGSSFVSGASSLADKWAQYQMTGALQVPTNG